MTKKEAIAHLYTHSSTNGSGQTTQAQHEEAKRMAIEALLQQPEIIHCQDCKYAKENNGELWICAHPDNNAWRITKEFYCGRAERREE